jgi:hypothetical protein
MGGPVRASKVKVLSISDHVLRVFVVVVAALGEASLGCTGDLPHPPYSPQATSALERVATTPPPGRVEVVPPRPDGADAWVDGEWILRHGRWYWLLGRWVKTPDGATYSPWVVVRAVDGTPFYAPSIWRDVHGAPLSPPAAVAAATASGEVVVDPAGDVEETGRNLLTAPTSAARPAPREAP